MATEAPKTWLVRPASVVLPGQSQVNTVLPSARRFHWTRGEDGEFPFLEIELYTVEVQGLEAEGYEVKKKPKAPKPSPVTVAKNSEADLPQDKE